MNRERMLQLADALEQGPLPVKFNMKYYAANKLGAPLAWHVGEPIPFGTTCCIGGLACLMFGEPGQLAWGLVAGPLLGLTSDQQERLFENDKLYVSKRANLEKITREEAVAAIRRMVKEEGGA